MSILIDSDRIIKKKASLLTSYTAGECVLKKYRQRTYFMSALLKIITKINGELMGPI